MNAHNTLECLFLARLPSLVSYQAYQQQILYLIMNIRKLRT
jgi:hypothetical protein